MAGRVPAAGRVVVALQDGSQGRAGREYTRQSNSQEARARSSEWGKLAGPARQEAGTREGVEGETKGQIL